MFKSLNFSKLYILTLLVVLLLIFFPKNFFMMEYQMFLISNIQWDFIVIMDSYSLIFSSTVLIISTSIFFYSLDYMASDKEKTSFFIFMIFFLISMLLLINSFSMGSILLGWDGLGVTSFGLIIYYHNYKSMNAAIITMLINRMGDFFIIFSMMMSLEMLTWNSMIFKKSVTLGLLIMISAFTKSAQFPFLIWLPKAMAAPTPVSSLVHSSTLVTAGSYLLFRYITLWEYSTLIYSVSLVTVLVGSLLALTSFDLKEIIAFSTLSQMGFLVFILAAKMKKIMFFHLITHAMFKAELFMCSGFFIYYSQGLQDIRLMYTKSNMVKFSFFFSLLAMSGVPFLSGFYSKDLAIEQIIYESTNVLINLSFVSTALLTSLYSSRLIFYLNLTKKKVSLNNMKDDYMSLSINFLVVFSLFLGSMYMWYNLQGEFEYSEIKSKITVLNLVIMGLMMGGFMNMKEMFFFNMINLFSMFPNLKFSFLMKILEKGWLNYMTMYTPLELSSSPYFKDIYMKKMLIMVFIIVIFMI